MAARPGAPAGGSFQPAPGWMTAHTHALCPLEDGWAGTREGTREGTGEGTGPSPTIGAEGRPQVPGRAQVPPLRTGWDRSAVAHAARTQDRSVARGGGKGGVRGMVRDDAEDNRRPGGGRSISFCAWQMRRDCGCRRVRIAKIGSAAQPPRRPRRGGTCALPRTDARPSTAQQARRLRRGGTCALPGPCSGSWGGTPPALRSEGGHRSRGGRRRLDGTCPGAEG